MTPKRVLGIAKIFKYHWEVMKVQMKVYLLVLKKMFQMESLWGILRVMMLETLINQTKVLEMAQKRALEMTKMQE